MPALLTSQGSLIYNGFTFPGETHVNVQSKPARDDAGRATLCQEITISAKTVIANTSGTDGEVLNVRQLLGEQGKALIFSGWGHGNDLAVNVSTAGLRDVRWGPKPEVVSWVPIGGAQACDVEWVCVTSVPICDMPGTVRSSGLMALNYSVSFSLDSRGYTTRTTAGYIEVAQTRVGKKTPDTADAYRSAVTPPLPDNFKRQWSWNLSADKSRLDFSIVDSEIPSPNAWPPGVVDIRGTHRTSWQRNAMMKVRHRISLDIEMAANYPMLAAYQFMLAVVTARVGAAKALTKQVFIEEVSSEEDLFGRKASFSVSWRIIGSLIDILTASGFWTPLGTNWPQWQASMAASFAQRGHAGLFHSASTDSIVDLCGPTGSIPWGGKTGTLVPFFPGNQQGLTNKKPTPDQSWLQYRNAIEIQRIRPVSQLSPIQEPDTELKAWNPNDAGGMVYPQKGGHDHVIQTGGRSRYKAVMKGHAERAGYEIPRPSLLKVGSQNVTETGGRFLQDCAGMQLGVPVYRAAWNLEYALPNSPEKTPPPNNMNDGVTTLTPQL